MEKAMGLKATDFASNIELTRREFVAATISLVGGAVLFDLPEQAYASDRIEICDSLGNAIDVSHSVSRVVPIGIYAQTLMETLYPGALVSLAKEVSSDASDFEKAGLTQVVKLPETGTPQGSFGKTVANEQILALRPDIVLQVGFGSGDVGFEVEGDLKQVGIQLVYLDIGFGKLAQAYRTLGAVLGCVERADELAKYVESTQMRAIEAAQVDAERIRVFYAPRVAGVKVNKGVCVHVNALKALGFEPVVSPYDFEGQTVDFEALREEDPDFVLLDDTSFPSEFLSAKGKVYELWKNVPAIDEERFAVAPALMHSILGSAVFVQSIGMIWMEYVLANGESCLDIVHELQFFYRLFYNLDKEMGEMRSLMGMGE